MHFLKFILEDACTFSNLISKIVYVFLNLEKNYVSNSILKRAWRALFQIFESCMLFYKYDFKICMIGTSSNLFQRMQNSQIFTNLQKIFDKFYQCNVVIIIPCETVLFCDSFVKSFF